MKIHRFNKKGIEKFAESLDLLKTGAPVTSISQLLNDPELTESIGGECSWLDSLDLNHKLATAKNLDKIVTKLELVSVERDLGFWTWLSAYLFEKLSKKHKNGDYKPGEQAIWICDYDNYQRYYRHYLASIWRVYRTHSNREELLKVILNGPVNTPGELWGQIAASQQLITNPSMLEAIYILYWDKSNNKRKHGAGGESPRRLTQVLKQFDKTWDFFSMSGEQIVELLPSEFDRFKEKKG